MKKQLIFALFFVSSFSGLQIKSAENQSGKTEEETRPPFLGREDLPVEIEEKILSMTGGSGDFWEQSKNLTSAAVTSKGHLQDLIPSYLVRVLLQSGKTPDQLFLEGLQQGTVNFFGLKLLKQTFKNFDVKNAFLLGNKSPSQLVLGWLEQGTISPFLLNLLKQTFKNFDVKEALKSSDETPDELLKEGVLKNTINIFGFDLLIKNGADPKKKDFVGNSLLFYAKNVDIAKRLLNVGIDPNYQNGRGQTALMFASLRNNKAIVELLLDHGANPKLKDNTGDSALKIAFTNGYMEIVDLLRDK